ncbi:hypothetical protein [Cycloclasticus pugetii]|uniref:hypothetical protein n=1 Tax=Cycloclasticus pugetii TaxID=34068 RepID=UPI003A92198D
MKLGFTISKVLGYILLLLGSAFILIGLIGAWMKDGFSGVQYLLSPFNILNWVTMVATLAPGFGLLMLSEKLRANQSRNNQKG